MSAWNTIFAMLKGIAYIGIAFIHRKFPVPFGTDFLELESSLSS